MQRRIVGMVAPPPELTTSEWADAERRLSSEASAEPGRWRTDRAPYQRGILDAINDHGTKGVVVMSSAQVGKTEFLLNMIGYHVDYDPAPILLLQPTVEMAQAFSKDRLAPMVRDTPALRQKVSDSKSRESGNTILHKTFPGGHITMAGANSPSSLASRPIRILLADEVDRYPVSAGSEGDPFNLAKKRTTTFWNSKVVAVSTPTVKGASRIEALYEDSTQEQYCLPCPSCGEYQPLRWRNIIFESVSHACEECGSEHKQDEWQKGRGEWIAQAEHSNMRGFHLNELVSPWRRWEDIIADFIQAKKSPETLKTFVNTSLGETWEEEGETVDGEGLLARREQYAAPVPEKTLVLTAGVDVQDDRLEVEVVGWGEAEESWNIDLRIIRGDPGRQQVWDDLDAVLNSTYDHESGHKLHIASTCIDSGGHFTQQVYDFCKTRQHRRVFAIKGVGGAGRPIVSAPSKKQSGRNKRKVDLFTVGVDDAKGLVYSRLRICDEGAGYCHFPLERDEEYFAQLTAEKIVTKFVRGFPRKEWVKTRARNEALDMRVYALAALRILNPVWQSLKTKLQPVEEPKPEQPETITQQRAKAKRGVNRKKGGFVNSWR